MGGLHSAVDSTLDGSSRGGKFKSKLGHITFMEIDHEIILWLFSPSADSRRAVVSY